MILDWVPAHFPRDDLALARFDGTALYEHDDPRRGAHPDWGTLVFNFGRHEVRNFLLANALFWLREFHVDGMRVDAVASMLYLDYSREEGEWIPNEFGGREDLDAVSFLKEMNEVVHGREPGVGPRAEESTAWPGVSRPTYLGGLGFGFKWNMGWMHDTLDYFRRSRSTAATTITSSRSRSCTRSARTSCCRCRTTRSSTARARCSARCRATAGSSSRTCARSTRYMWAHPGKKLLFMGGELAPGARSGATTRSLDWHLLERPEHAGIQALVRELNRALPRTTRALAGRLHPAGFRWLEANDAGHNVVVFAAVAGGDRVAGLRLQPLAGPAAGLPRRASRPGRWHEILNTDSRTTAAATSATRRRRSPSRARGTTSRSRRR